jgi:hypothetical protein
VDATQVELDFYYHELVPAMERLRSMGYKFPTAEQLEQAGSLIVGYGDQPSADLLFPTGVAGTYTP